MKGLEMEDQEGRNQWEQEKVEEGKLGSGQEGGLSATSCLKNIGGQKGRRGANRSQKEGTIGEKQADTDTHLTGRVQKLGHRGPRTESPVLLQQKSMNILPLLSVAADLKKFMLSFSFVNGKENCNRNQVIKAQGILYAWSLQCISFLQNDC